MILCHQCGTPHGEVDRFCPSCGVASAAGAEASKDPLVGRTIAGSYVILELVGVGGMGRVYRAEQRMLGRTVAIKVIHPHLLSDEQSVARFYTEARAASRLNHPNSVSIIDFGRTDDGILYLVMEYLQGKDLARLIREDGPLPLPRVCEIVRAVLDALGEAHALDVVHRDLKPENVIIERLRAGGDLVKVVDFGLAKLLSGQQQGTTSITLPGLVCGTPDYMSPEQGRGEEVDARGDIYSVGVMLFELLTDRLPFLGDTPTNVVLKHIQEPVPDPRELVPERGIPDSLVEIVMHALAKSPAERYQRTDEMASDLRRVAMELSPRSLEITCGSCGHRSPVSKRFCAECGAPLQSHPTPTSRMSLPPRVTIARDQHPVLVGRHHELEQIEALRASAKHKLVTVNVVGEAGVGRTRLLAEVAERADKAGDLAVGAGPHESGAPVAYHPVITLLRTLLACDDAALLAIAERETDPQPLVAAGLREAITPVGVVGSTTESKVGAVASALGFAIRAAEQRVSGKRIVIVVDDLHRCDGLSARVFAELPRYLGEASVLLIIASGKARPVPLPAGTTVVELRGFTMREAKAFTAGRPVVADDEPDPDDRLLTPLYLVQLLGLNIAIDGPRNTLPSRLADAVAQRIQRLNVNSRRLLQAIAVLGRSAAKADVARIAGHEDMAGLPLLLARGFVVESLQSLEIIHPFVRDMVEASTPAQARKALHLRALELAAELDQPLEVRAHHAYGAGEALSALVLLERLGDVSALRGDLETAVLGYQRGIELARREVLESGDTSLDDALASMSRRLGIVLARRGDITGAEGVLREALEYSRPTGLPRAQILVALARVAAERDRERDASRLLGQALELAYRDDALSAQVEVQATLAEIRSKQGDAKGAIAARKALVDLLADQAADQTRRAAAALDLAELHADDNDAAAARTMLARARGLLDEHKSPYLAARAAALQARLEGMAGNRELALSQYLRAVRLSSLAGAADLAQRYEAAASQLLVHESGRPAAVLRDSSA